MEDCAPRLRVRRAAAVVALLCLVGCFGTDTTPFPDGLEPLEMCKADPPAPLPGDPHPEQLNTVRGSTSAFEWVHGRAYVHASIADVKQALLVPEVVIDRRQVDSWTYDQDFDPTYEHTLRIHNTVNDVITVQFDITWRFGPSDPMSSEPDLYLARWQKTAGSTVISILEGSLVARPIDDHTTELEIVEHVKALASGADQLEQYLKDLFANILATVNGQPLPTF